MMEGSEGRRPAQREAGRPSKRRRGRVRIPRPPAATYTSKGCSPPGVDEPPASEAATRPAVWRKSTSPQADRSIQCPSAAKRCQPRSRGRNVASAPSPREGGLAASPAAPTSPSAYPPRHGALLLRRVFHRLNRRETSPHPRLRRPASPAKSKRFFETHPSRAVFELPPEPTAKRGQGVGREVEVVAFTIRFVGQRAAQLAKPEAERSADAVAVRREPK